MRLNILFLHNHKIDERELTAKLNKEECTLSITRLTKIEDLSELLDQEAIDLFVVKAPNDELVKYAKKILRVRSGHEFPVLCIMKNEDNKTVSDLRDLAIKHIVYEEPTSQSLASLINLIVQKDRYKKQLNVTGSYIKEATIVCEKDKDGDFIFKHVNKAFLDLEGLTNNDLLEKKLKNSHLLFGLKSLLEDMEDVYEKHSPIHMPNYFYLKDGVREWCDVYIYNPNPEQIAVISANLSEIKRAHDKATYSNRYLQTILNAQKHIIYITDGEKLINTNQAFLDFFQAMTMFDFIKEHKKVCNVFEKSSEPFYIDGNEPGWHRKVALNTKEQYKIRIKHEEEMKCFVPSTQIINVEGKEQYVVVLTDITELESEKEKLRLLAMTDALTGASNRLKFNTMMEKFVDLAQRYKTPLSVIMFDVDNFKKVNDNYSHHAGDEVLKDLVTLIDENVRKADLFVRWGGDEFLIVLANSNSDNAVIVAEKFRMIIQEHDFPLIDKVSCSFGVTSLAKDDTIPTLISRVDEALYKSKTAGRNCVTELSKY